MRFCPDVAVFDISMNAVNGPEAVRRLHAIRPEIKVLGLTMHDDTSYVREMLDAGARGYVLKRAASEELITALRAVAANGNYVDPRVTGRLLDSLIPRRNGAVDPAGLSEREAHVLRLIAQGFSNKEIACQLEVSVKTIETYKARGMEKAGLRSRVDIVRHATGCGWLSP